MLFDIYEHPGFEASYEDALSSRRVARHIGIGTLVTAVVAATALWRWKDRGAFPSLRALLRPN
jgi:hypothetical protein